MEKIRSENIKRVLRNRNVNKVLLRRSNFAFIVE